MANVQSPSEHTKLQLPDKDVSFRFLELPAEIRDLVYDELLVFHGRWKCWPQILATSKQIHDEACGVFYNTNIAEIELHTAIKRDFRTWGRPDTFCINVNGQQIYRRDQRWPIIIRYAFTSWPVQLRKFRHFRIIIRTNQERNGRGIFERHHLFRPVNHHLYSLCSFLAENKTFTNLIVELREQSNQGSKLVPDKTIWPLLKLAVVEQIHFKGMPSGPVRYLQRESAENRPAPLKVNTFGDAMAMCRLVTTNFNSASYIDYDYDYRLAEAMTTWRPLSHKESKDESATDITQGKEVIDLTQETGVLDPNQGTEVIRRYC